MSWLISEFGALEAEEAMPVTCFSLEVDSFVGERDFLLRTSDTYRSTVAFAFAALWRLQIEKSSHSKASTCCVSFRREAFAAQSN